MSLQTDVHQSGRKDLAEALEEQARRFDKLAGMANNKEARVFYNSLTDEEKAYLNNHPKYGWRVNAVFRMQT